MCHSEVSIEFYGLQEDGQRFVSRCNGTAVRRSTAYLVSHLIVNLPRQRYPARLRHALDPSRHIHSIAEQVIALNHDVSNMDADPQRKAALAVGPLYRLGAADRLNSVGELNQEAVPTA